MVFMVKDVVIQLVYFKFYSSDHTYNNYHACIGYYKPKT